MPKEIDFIGSNPCGEISIGNEVQTVTVASGGSYTITLPAAQSGSVMVSEGGHKMVYDGNRWLRITPCRDDVTKYTSVELQESMSNIEALFEFYEQNNLDGSSGLVPLAESAREYNRCEEEMIRRSNLPEYNLEITLDGLSMEPGSPARILVDAVAEQIRSALNGLEETKTP